MVEIRPLEAELFLANGQTDMAKQIVAFPIFPNSPKKKDIATW